MTTTTNNLAGPTLAPPGELSTSEAGGLAAPTATEEQIATIAGDSAAAPTLTPPSTAGAVTADGVTVSWHTNVLIDALWSIDQTRNVFVHIVGVGWKKIFNGRDGSFQALVTLASQARQTNRPASLREEADGMIYEIYLW